MPAAELHAEELIGEGAAPGEGEVEEADEDASTPSNAVGVDANGDQRTNQNIVDDASTQKMTMDEIEALKQGTTGAGRDIITKLLASHSALDQKTAFSRAKYMVRKRKKYLKRFMVLPVDVSRLMNWMVEQKKDAARVMELRDESLGLVGCWANVHFSGEAPKPSGRWLIVDDTGGLVIAAMAERMGILHKEEEDEKEQNEGENETSPQEGPPKRQRVPAMSATNCTLTALHTNIQPNLTMLKYFNFDVNDPDESHPLHTHLKALSWLQLLKPGVDSMYARKPDVLDDATLAGYKPSKRGQYYRKHRRHERIRSVVDETRAGGFDGLIVASHMDLPSILRHAVPLLSGSAPVVVYSPFSEPVVGLADLYSTARRTAFILAKRELAARKRDTEEEVNTNELLDGDDFPVDPTLLLGSTVQTSRVRAWQVLPGRTHPMMTGRGGAEGYVFHATRVIPVEGVEARGTGMGRKKQKAGVEAEDGVERKKQKIVEVAA